MGRLANVAVVESDDAKSLGRQSFAQRLRPENELRGEAHDQQNERIAVASEALIFNVDSVGADSRHGGPPAGMAEYTNREAGDFKPITSGRA